MDVVFSSQALMVALLIFSLRVVNMSISTLRIMLVMRGNKWITWVLSFAEASIFILALTYVMQDLNNWLYIVAYAAGFATGNVVGMWFEGRLAIGYVHMRIISMTQGKELAGILRNEGYAVTELPGRGRDGEVSLLIVSIRRKHEKKVREIAEKIDVDAFITSEDLHPISRGYWR
jgi:uncharacterized protein YebE (UPF0316 family)